MLDVTEYKNEKRLLNDFNIVHSKELIANTKARYESISHTKIKLGKNEYTIMYKQNLEQ